MPKRKPAPKFKPNPADGPLPQWTDADIDRLADVTPEDVSSAKAFWRAKATPKVKRLLDAKARRGQRPTD